MRQPTRPQIAATLVVAAAQHWIDILGLVPHPEGGWYREAYRSPETIGRQALANRFTGDRAYSTAIYFLLSGTEVSALHTIKQDEVWHFYDGSSLTIHMIDPDGRYSTATLGRDPGKDQTPMAVVKAGWLFGATVEPDSYALLGCTVAPGFDVADFELPSRERLLAQYPQHRKLIEHLSPEP